MPGLSGETSSVTLEVKNRIVLFGGLDIGERHPVLEAYGSAPFHLDRFLVDRHLEAEDGGLLNPRMLHLIVAVDNLFDEVEFDLVARLEPGNKIVLLMTGPRGETWADFTRNPPVLSSAGVLYFGA